MGRPASSEPTERELEMLSVLWQLGPSRLGAICDALSRDRRPATTTVATMLKVMLDKRLVQRRRGTSGYIWSARQTRESTASGILGRLVDRVFNGSASRLITQLMEESQLTTAEMAEIRQLIDNKTGTGKRGATNRAGKSAKTKRKTARTKSTQGRTRS